MMPRVIREGERESARAVKVLVADDEQFILDFARNSLELKGYQVVVFPDGAPVLEDADLDSVDLAIIDFAMPTPGDVVVRTLRERGFTFPIVITAGFLDEELEAHVLRLGTSEVLKKPFGPRDLTALVERLLGFTEV